MMEFTIGLSRSETLRRVYAISALRSYNNQNVREIPILGRDQRKALEVVYRDAVAQTAMLLSPIITGFDESPDGENVTLTLDVEASGGTFGEFAATMLEEAVACMVLGAALADDDSTLAEDYRNRAEAKVKAVRATLTMPSYVAGLRLSSNG